MSALERCVHQIMPTGAHISFLKGEWERCKECKYDPENNKRCPNYSPTSYYVPDDSDKKPEIVSEQTEKMPEPVFESLKLNFSTLPISQN